MILKKFLFISIFFLCSICANAQAYIYQPMPDSNAIWRVDWSSSLFCSSLGTYSKYQYTMSGDTIIGINTYKKIYKSGTGNMCGTVGSYFSNYAGGMRQDTINKKVYFICPSFLTDTLINDFSVNVGDTMHTVWCTFGSPNGYTQNLVVSIIDSVLVGSSYHKRFNLNNSFSFIEGIGNNTGLLEPLDIGQNDFWQLVCFTHDTITYQTSPFCSIITGREGEQKEENMYQIHIYPNPVEDISILEFTANIKKAVNLLIYDAFGNLVKTHSNVTSNKLNIYKQNFNKGLYFIRLNEGNERSATMRFIVN